MIKRSPVCEVCEKPLMAHWTDTHGIAQCCVCGAPYRFLHYDGDKRVDKSPELLLNETGIADLRRFHRETGGKLSAVGLQLSFPGGYDVASADDIRKMLEWQR